MPNVQLDSFKPLTEDEVNQIISNSSKKSCPLDPMPSHLVVDCQDVLLLVITRMINLSLQSGCFQKNWKLAKVYPSLKKSTAEVVFDNLRPISNLSFVSKLTERLSLIKSMITSPFINFILKLNPPIVNIIVLKLLLYV